MIIEKDVIAQPAGTNWANATGLEYSLFGIYIKGNKIFGRSVRGVWCSEDNGETWSKLNIYQYDNIISMILTSTGRLIISRNNNTAYSDDDGETWQILDNAGYSFRCITNTGRIIAENNSDSTYYSDDNGETWSQLQSYNAGRCAIACITNTGRILTRGYNSTTTLHYSDDNGSTWATISAPIKFGSLYTTASGRILAGADINQNAFMPDEGIWCSDDDGETWTKVYDYDFTTAFCELSTGRIFAIEDTPSGGQLKYSDDGGETWNIISINGLPSGFHRWTAINATNTGRVLLSHYSGNDRIWYSDPTTQRVVEQTKYLDQNGAQEIVTQFKSYCNSLVGGE